MELDRTHALVETLRKRAIGEPQWIAAKQVYEYQEQSRKVVAILKLVRAAQGLTAMLTLCKAGLFIDFGAAIRCVNDCLEEVYFLLETYPQEASSNVNKFVTAFFENTIDEYLSPKTPTVPRDKIRSAVARTLSGGQDEATQNSMKKIHLIFCGYIHANYAHIMEVYNVAEHNFNLAGVPSEKEKAMRMEYADVLSTSVLLCAAFVADRLNLKDIRAELMRAIG